MVKTKWGYCLDIPGYPVSQCLACHRVSWDELEINTPCCWCVPLQERKCGGLMFRLVYDENNKQLNGRW